MPNKILSEKLIIKIINISFLLLAMITSIYSSGSAEKVPHNNSQFPLSFKVYDGQHLEQQEIAIKNKMSGIDAERIETFKIKMPQLSGRERTIIMYLPVDYDSSDTAYPVLYVQDGLTLFMPSEENDSPWSIDLSLFDFYKSGFTDDFIIVGIGSDPRYRWEEYSPWVNDDMYLWMDPYDANRVEGGEGDNYIKFIIETLKPYIDNQYRTLPDQKNTAIAGYQMGGLISLYAGLTQPNVFSKVLAMSPAVWFAEGGDVWLSKNHLLELIMTLGSPDNVTFYLDIAERDRTTDLAVRPVVHNKKGEKISFPEAYLDGLRQVVTHLIQNGLSISNIISGIDNHSHWTEDFEELDNDRDLANFRFYFPIFMTPAVPPKFSSTPATTFVINHNNQFVITTESLPLAEITYTGTLPAGVSFTDNGDGTATLSYDSTGSDVEGVFPLRIWADNGTTEPTVQYFELRIAHPSGLACPTSESCLLNFDMSMTPFLSRTRRIWVYLPPNYNTSDLNYQVLYIPDAQHIFGFEATGVELEPLWDWKFDETLDNLYEATSEGTIVVGVEYDARYPWDEYSPWNNYNMNYWIGDSAQNFSGVGDEFLHFIVYELKPLIDSSYRTKPDRENTAIGGGSRCALFALYAGLREPDEFSKVMAFSPAVWLANNSTNFWYTNNGLKIWFDRNKASTDVRYFQYVGTNEDASAGGFYKEGVDYVHSELIKDGVTTSSKIVNLGGTHYPGVWAPYVDDALYYLNFY